MGVRFLIADDHEVVRQGVRDMIARRPNWEVCGEAADGQEAVRLTEQLKPDVVILDISMPKLGGVATLYKIRQFDPHTKVVIFTLFESQAFAELAKGGGADAFVMKTQPSRDLIAAVEAVLQGSLWPTFPLVS